MTERSFLVAHRGRFGARRLVSCGSSSPWKNGKKVTSQLCHLIDDAILKSRIRAESSFSKLETASKTKIHITCSVFILIFLVFHVLEKEMREVSACAFLVSANGSLYVTLVSYDAESYQEIPRCLSQLREELAAATADDVHRLESALREFRAAHMQDKDELNKAYTRLYHLHRDGKLPVCLYVCTYNDI